MLEASCVVDCAVGGYDFAFLSWFESLDCASAVLVILALDAQQRGLSQQGGGSSGGSSGNSNCDGCVWDGSTCAWYSQGNWGTNVAYSGAGGGGRACALVPDAVLRRRSRQRRDAGGQRRHGFGRGTGAGAGNAAGESTVGGRPAPPGAGQPEVPARVGKPALARLASISSKLSTTRRAIRHS